VKIGYVLVNIDLAFGDQLNRLDMWFSEDFDEAY